MTAQTVTRFAVSRPHASRGKHLHPTNSSHTRSPCCAESFPIDLSHHAGRDPKSADEGRHSFAKKSGEPPFSLGLQSFLEFLLHKIGVPRVSHRVHEIDALSDKQLDKAIVHGMHAVAMSDLNQSRYLRKTPVPDTRLDSRVRRHQFRRQTQASPFASRQEILTHHSQQRPRKLGSDKLLALPWKGINNAPNSRWRIVRVHGCNHEVPCFRCRNRGLHRVRVPHLSHENDVRILSQRVLKRGRETVRIGTNFALVNQASPLRMNEFDGVVNTDDVDGTPFGYRLSHARQRGALAFAARASQQYQAGSLVTPLIHHWRMSQRL